MYTFLTPFGVGWSLPQKQKGERWDLMKFVRREHEALFFCLWIAIAVGAMGRWVAGFDLILFTPEVVVATCMGATFTATAFAMFVL